MSNTMDQMKKMIEEKKKKSSKQGLGADTVSKKNIKNTDVFKNTKRGGALNK